MILVQNHLQQLSGNKIIEIKLKLSHYIKYICNDLIF